MEKMKKVFLGLLIAFAFCCGFSVGMHFEHLRKIEITWQNAALSQALFCLDRVSGGKAQEEAMARLHSYNQAAITNSNLYPFSELTRSFVVDLLKIEQAHNQKGKRDML